MPTWLIIVIVVLIVLAVGGAIAARRRLERTRPSFERRLAQVNRDLAAALAEDRGWDPEHLEETARAAWAEQRPGDEPEAVTLHEVLDRPGKQEDKAIFLFRAGGRDHLLTLGRSDDEWRFESLS
jgi:hypothetical protein